MAKININGELFDHDFGKRMMSEALALEEETGQRYADWEAELASGSLKGFAGLVWLIWRRDGRDVPYADILSGKADFDLQAMFLSLKAALEEIQAEQDPKAGGSPGQTAGTATTPGSTHRS